MSNENQAKLAKLFNLHVRCEFCLKTLYSLNGVLKRPGIKVDYVQCKEHPDSGCVLEWEPVE